MVIVEALKGLYQILRGMGVTLRYFFVKPITVQYPEERVRLHPRFRGRHELQRQENGLELCVGCGLCAAYCPAACIYVEAAENTEEDRLSGGERYAKVYEINLSRCIFCGYCEEACPTYAIQLTPDFEMAEYNRQNLVYEKEDLLISGPGKYPGYNFWRVAGVQIGGKDKGQAENEAPPQDLHTLTP